MESVGACGGEKRMLASELAQVQAMVRELEARVDQDLPAAARELCGALASSVDRSIRIARTCWPAGPDSPGSAGGDGDGDGNQDPAGGGNVGKDGGQCKSRKGMPRVRRQVRVASVQDTAALDDGLSWRKYGQKEILGAKYPRAYFRCTHRPAQGCLATKQVQRVDGDPLLYDVVYLGAHTCVQAVHPTAEQLRQQLQQPGHAGEEQSSLLALETEGFHAGFEPTAPSSFADVGGCFPLLSPTSLEWQLRSSGPGVDMEFEPQLEELFSNPSDCFQWEFQDLYEAN